jgi:hypothetical protein
MQTPLSAFPRFAVRTRLIITIPISTPISNTADRE